MSSLSVNDIFTATLYRASSAWLWERGKTKSSLSRILAISHRGHMHGCHFRTVHVAVACHLRYICKYEEDRLLVAFVFVQASGYCWVVVLCGVVYISTTNMDLGTPLLMVRVTETETLWSSSGIYCFACSLLSGVKDLSLSVSLSSSQPFILSKILLQRSKPLLWLDDRVPARGFVNSLFVGSLKWDHPCRPVSFMLFIILSSLSRLSRSCCSSRRNFS